MPVYTYFQPPRWLCRVGDFKSIEEAHVAMRQLKASGTFKEVSIVREQMPVYTYFQPPRWLCRVGDFKSIEEAHVAMRQLKASGTFKEVSIVREQINIPLD